MWARALSLVSKQHEEERPKPKGFAGLAAQASAQQRAGLLQASGSRDAEDGEEPIPEEVAELVQEYSVVLEYERIQDLIPRGIYLVPSFDSRAEWHGIVCLRGGFWKGASFKFKILLGEDYPGKPPEIYFASELYHPAVCARTWRFQTEAFFPAWQEGRDYLACVLPFFYRALRHQRHFVRLSGAPPLNPDAFQLLKSDPEAFATRAAADAQRSADVAYDNAPGFALEFARNPACTERILERLDVNPKLRPDVQAQSFADWFCDHYAAEQQKAEKREKHELEESLSAPILEEPETEESGSEDGSRSICKSAKQGQEDAVAKMDPFEDDDDEEPESDLDEPMEEPPPRSWIQASAADGDDMSSSSDSEESVADGGAVRSSLPALGGGGSLWTRLRSAVNMQAATTLLQRASGSTAGGYESEEDSAEDGA
eukprot:TRINITY_DN14894_c0_g1_i2.p1 TRINITY_DN14894_c0_g1~~TRINITY_DN14894_c0_g1_i2.p1  ORF type:complete len:428 (-),score=112.61 TRINITY_DN14894_c0_g1_i2:240-1523(-)